MTDDTIYRQDAIDAILHNKEVYSNNFGDDPIDRYTIAIIYNDAQTIARLPSAQQERKKGRWIDAEKAPFDMWYATCSECGKRQTLEYLNYCPNCGHPMEVAK